MGRRAKGSIPAATIDKTSGRERVRVDGKVIWLGKAGTPRAKANYHRVVAAYAANGGSLPPGFRLTEAVLPTDTRPALPASSLTVADILLAALTEVAAGRSEHELRKVSRWSRLRTVAFFLEPYQSVPAVEFGPRTLKDIAGRLAATPIQGTNRTRTKKQCQQLLGEIRRLFRDAVAMELLPPERLTALESLRNVKFVGAAPSKKRKPVDPGSFDAALAMLPAVVADALRFMQLVGCRPTEALQATPGQFDTSQRTWLWRPDSHKTAHLGQDRSMWIGPKARKILKRWMTGKQAGEFIFSRGDMQRAATATVKLRRLRTDGECFQQEDLRQRVRRACQAAGVDVWTPYQLRHAGLTRIRKEGGIEAAQWQADHSDQRQTEAYTGCMDAGVMAVIEKIG